MRKKFTDKELRMIRDHPRLPYNVRKMAADLLENNLTKRVREQYVKSGQTS